jgi:hypothetical protein
MVLKIQGNCKSPYRIVKAVRLLALSTVYIASPLTDVYIQGLLAYEAYTCRTPNFHIILA